jgi:hypothetical protein
MKNILVHSIYVVAIILLLLLNYKTGAFLKIFFPHTQGGIELQNDVEIVNSKTGELLGSLKKGVVLSNPLFEDLIACNVDGMTSKGFTRMKLLVGLDLDLLPGARKASEADTESGTGVVNLQLPKKESP